MGGIFASIKTMLRSLFRAFQGIKTWQLGLILVPLIFISATLLRFDHLKMVDLKSAVLAADQENNDEAIAESLLRLKQYADTHTVVNFVEKNGVEHLTFGTGPFYLENQYLRKATAELAKAEQKVKEISDANPNGNIFAKAMSICQPLAQRNGWEWTNPEYLNCYTSELAKYPAADEITTSITADIPSTSLYRYDFASPIFAPTLAGFSCLITLILSVVIFIRILIWCILRLSLLFLNKARKA